MKYIRRIKVAVLGATGMVGQVFTWMLAEHKLFTPFYLAASPAKKGLTYVEAARWSIPVTMPESVKSIKIRAIDIKTMKEEGIKVVFSALPEEIAKDIEPKLREENFYVFSNASAMRYEEDIPILIPEANPDDISFIEKQGFPERGFVITNANCSTTGLAVALAPLKKFTIQKVFVSTLQAISGAGYPGLSAMDIISNAIPFIRSEEEKMKKELKKILHSTPEIYTTCIRIPVTFGHLESVWIKLKDNPSLSNIVEEWNKSNVNNSNISSMPEKSIIYRDKDDFPQPKLSFEGNPPGMSVYTGRLRKECDYVGFVLLINNIVKGAAGGSIQNADLFYKNYRNLL